MNYIFPVKDYLTITQIYHMTGTKHYGIDFGWCSAHKNQPVVACEDGTVVGRCDGYGNTYHSQKIYGNYVNIAHADGNYTMYAHLEKGSVCVKKGDKVTKGQVIGHVGSSGYSTGEHLHFEFRKGKNAKLSAIDPINILAVEGSTPIISEKSKQLDLILHRQIVNPVDRDRENNQVYVKSDGLNMRTDHSTTANKLGTCAVGFFNVVGTFVGNDYIWYQIADEVWIAGTGKTEFYAAEANLFYKSTVFDIPEYRIEEFETIVDNLGYKFMTEEQ